MVAFLRWPYARDLLRTSASFDAAIVCKFHIISMGLLPNEICEGGLTDL